MDYQITYAVKCVYCGEICEYKKTNRYAATMAAIKIGWVRQWFNTATKRGFYMVCPDHGELTR